MEEQKIEKIVMIGAGRLAWHLASALQKQGLEIIQVFNRTPARGRRLAGRTGASYTGNIRDINLSADLYIMAVSDEALAVLAAELRLADRLVVHTSGSMALDILAPVSKITGVFYPLQTFAHASRISFKQIPVCIEATSSDAEHQLHQLALRLTRTVCILDSEKRRMLHLGAVFVSNFTNHLYGVAEELLGSRNIPFSMLEPLIRQTAANASRGNIFTLQTGPAVRGDLRVLENHYELLAGYPGYLEIYKTISAGIIKKK